MATMIEGPGVGSGSCSRPAGRRPAPCRDRALGAAVESDAGAVLAAGASCHHSYRQGEVFFEVVAPPPLSDGVVAAPAAALPSDLELDPGAAAVIMTHSYERDRALLRLVSS
jgi:hypothetical protein